MLELIIIPNEEVLELDEQIVEYKNLDLLDGHLVGLQDFIENNNIDIKSYKQ